MTNSTKAFSEVLTKAEYEAIQAAQKEKDLMREAAESMRAAFAEAEAMSESMRKKSAENFDEYEKATTEAIKKAKRLNKRKPVSFGRVLSAAGMALVVIVATVVIVDKIEGAMNA